MSTTDAAPIVPSSEPTCPTPSTARLASFALVAALLASAASWGAAEAIHERFQPRTATFKGIPTLSETQAAGAMLTVDLARRASVAFGILGGFLGLALGVAGGLARRSPRGAVVAAVAGGLVGAATAAVAARVIFQAAPKLTPPMLDDLIAAILVQGLLGAFIGAAAGAALGMGSGRRVVAGAIGGLVGGTAGFVLHQLVGAAAFPLASTTEALAEAPAARITAHVLPAALSALGAALALTTTGRRAAATSESGS